MFVALIYHLVDEKNREEFNDELIDIFLQIPKSEDFFCGHDINASVGVRKNIYANELVTYGIENRNKKGRILMGEFLTKNLKVRKNFFKNRRILLGNHLVSCVPFTY